MEELIVELRLFLELLDHEYLTSTVREKKAVIADILLRLQSAKGGRSLHLPSVNVDLVTFLLLPYGLQIS